MTSSDNQVAGTAGVVNSAGVTGSQKGEYACSGVSSPLAFGEIITFGRRQESDNIMINCFSHKSQQNQTHSLPQLAMCPRRITYLLSVQERLNNWTCSILFRFFWLAHSQKILFHFFTADFAPFVHRHLNINDLCV